MFKKSPNLTKRKAKNAPRNAFAVGDRVFMLDLHSTSDITKDEAQKIKAKMTLNAHIIRSFFSFIIVSHNI